MATLALFDNSQNFNVELEFILLDYAGNSLASTTKLTDHNWQPLSHLMKNRLWLLHQMVPSVLLGVGESWRQVHGWDTRELECLFCDPQ